MLCEYGGWLLGKLVLPDWGNTKQSFCVLKSRETHKVRGYLQMDISWARERERVQMIEIIETKIEKGLCEYMSCYYLARQKHMQGEAA